MHTKSATRNAVAFCTDQAGLPFTLYAANSLVTANPSRNFDVLICSLAPLNMPSIIADLGLVSHVITPSAHALPTTLNQTRLPLTTYLRLLLPSHFATTYERILYLDFDTRVVSSDIDALLDIELGPHALAGVTDKMQWHNPDHPVLDFADCGIACTRYLNAGVLLMDLAKWLDQDLTPKMMQISASLDAPRFHDQTLLNLTLKGAFAELSPVWNWQLSLRFPKITQRIRPKILHFTGDEKPWLLGCTPNMMSSEYITSYQAFLAIHGLSNQFPVDENAMRMPLHVRLKAAYKQHMASIRVDRLMARFPDPFVPLI